MLNGIHHFIVIVFSLPLLIISPITKILTQVVYKLTFGLVHMLLHLTRNIFFFIPTIIFSKIYESGIPVLKPIAYLGLPFSVLGSITGTLIGFGGEHKPTAFDLGFYACYPLSNTFNNFVKEGQIIGPHLIGERQLLYTVCQNNGITEIVNRYIN